MAELICIICPKGCRLSVDGGLNVAGNSCERGAEYAVKELTNPVRTVTSTARITGALHRRLPVRTSAPIPKMRMMEAVRLLDSVEVRAPVKMGDVIAENILGTGADFIAERDMEENEKEE